MADEFKEYKGRLPKKILDEIKEKCPKSKLKKVLKKTYEQYMDAMAQPGECVGLVGAESVKFFSKKLYDKRLGL